MTDKSEEVLWPEYPTKAMFDRLYELATVSNTGELVFEGDTGNWAWLLGELRAAELSTRAKAETMQTREEMQAEIDRLRGQVAYYEDRMNIASQQIEGLRGEVERMRVQQKNLMREIDRLSRREGADDPQ